MMAELVSIMIKNNGVEGIKIGDKQIIISQFADGTPLFLENERQIPKALDLINQFSKVAGLKLNVDKCEILALRNQQAHSISNIKIKTVVKYLGIVVTRNKELREKENIHKNITKCKTMLNSWLRRDITIFGRVLLLKMESLSRVIHPAFSLKVYDKMVQLINNVNFKFIWKNKCQYIRKADMVKNLEEGGLGAIDFSAMNGALKLKW